MRVESAKLRKLRADLENLPHTSTWPEYKPHIAIAYLKPDAPAKDYVARGNPYEGETMTLKDLFYKRVDYSADMLEKLMLPSARIRRADRETK